MGKFSFSVVEMSYFILLFFPYQMINLHGFESRGFLGDNLLQHTHFYLFFQSNTINLYLYNTFLQFPWDKKI